MTTEVISPDLKVVLRRLKLSRMLDTLPEREYRSGLAEVVKYGVILDPEFFAYLEQNTPAILRKDPGVMQYIVTRCCRLKADIV